MVVIDVTPGGPDEYAVTVREGRSATAHSVTAVDAAAVELGVSSTELVVASFRFLLDREPKESILPRFALGVISTYFPEYESSIEAYLRA